MRPASFRFPVCRAIALLLFAAVCTIIFTGCWQREKNVDRGIREQVLHRGINPDVPDLDPHLATTGADTNVLMSLFEGLVTEDPVDLSPAPGVAETWDVLPDGRTYTFRLRANAKWSNGDPVTARDFVRSFQRILTPSLLSDYASFLYVIQNAEAFHKGELSDFSKVGILAQDEHTLRILLEHPTPHFLAMLSHTAFYPVHVGTIEKYGGFADRGNAWARPGQFVGNGPFVLDTWKIGQRIGVTKSPTYWDSGNVRLNGIQFHIIESRDAEERAFRAGQLHVTEALPPSKIDTYKRTQPEVLRIDPYLGVEFYRLNVSRPFLSDAKVRRALSLAIDRKAIAENILRGGQTPASMFTPPNTAGYTAVSSLKYDPAAAKALLAEAGYTDGAGAPVLELLFNPSESHRAVAEAIQEMWRRELGIDVRLISQEFKTMVAARRTGDFQLLRSVWIADYADPLSFLSIFSSGNGNNFTGWSDRTYDQILFEAARIPDPAARNELLQKAEALLLEQSPVIPIYHYTHVFLLHPSVRNWHPNLLDHHPYKHVYLQAP